MPFDKTKPIDGVPLEGGTVGISEYDTPDPSFLETVAAGYREGNIISSALSSPRLSLGVKEFGSVDPGYDPFSDIAGYEDYADRFENVYNPKAAAAVKAGIDQELKDKRTIDASGWVGVAVSLAANLTDPTILLPAGALVRTGKIGYAGARSALAVGAGAAAGTAVQEGILQATQETRSGATSALAIGGSAILGGLIGYGASKFLSKGEWDRASASILEDVSGDLPNPAEVTDTIVSRMQSAGAAAVDDVKLDDLGIGGDRAAQIVANATNAARINPGIRTMFSPSVRVRETYAKLVDNPVYTRMEMEGQTLGPSVENIVKQYQRGALSQWIKESRALYKQAKKAGFTGTKQEFYERVTRALRRNDVDEGGNEYITRAAQIAREKIYDPSLQRAIKAGMLPEDVKTTTAASYVTRFWNRQKLIGEEDRFREIAREYFRAEIAKLPPDAAPEFVSEADLYDYIEEVVTSVFNNLTGRGKGDVPEWIVPVTRGPLKERTFRIQDALVEDFLENDAEAVLRRYTRTVGAEIELAEKFGRADMRDQFEAINKEYDELSKAATDPKKRAELDARRKEDIRNLEAFRDLVRGTYRAADESSAWSAITRGALTWNYMRLLGGVTLTSLTDASRPIAVHGLRATMREALPALVSNVKAARIARQDAKDLGAVTEAVLQTRLSSLAELQDPYRYGSAYERFLSNASNVFSKATGLAWWNDTIKTVSAVMTQNRMARNAIGYGSIGKKERAYMAFLGIDENMAGRIARQIERHGIQERGIWGANVSAWDDEVARRTWAAALNKDVDRTIVTKGAADQPLWTRTNTGRLIMQFKSFGLASHQRVLMAGLQENQLRLAESMVFAATLGMLISWLKFAERGDFEQADRLVENPGLWISNGVDRSGILSIPYEISNTAEKVGLPVGITTAAQAVAGDPDQGGTVSRYASRNKLGAVLGPSAGLFQDLATIAEQMSRGEMTKGGTNAIIRQIPGGTLPGVRTGLHGFIKPAIQD